MKRKKKIVITFCVTMMLMFCVKVTALASGGTLAFDISGPDLVKQGETITLKVNANEAGLTDGKAIITYDEAMLTYQCSELVYSTEENMLEFVVNSNEPGKLIVVWATVNPMESASDVFTMDFIASQSIEDGQSTEIGVEVEYVNDAEGNSLAMSTEGNKDSMTIQIGEKTPGPGPGPNPDPDPNPNPDPSPDPDPNPNPGPDPEPNPDPNPGTDPDPKPDSKPDSKPGTDNSNNGGTDGKLPTTGGSTPIMREIAILFVMLIVIFEFVIRFRRKGERS